MGTSVRLQAVCDRVVVGEYGLTDAEACVIGRAADCDLRVPDSLENSTASRYHCRVEANEDGVFVYDLGSRNGTFLNGFPVGRRPTGLAPLGGLFAGPGFPLGDGDELRVGETLLRVRIREAPGSSTEATGRQLAGAC
jgi:pSer/pThr/pTyr-binding forkhead associated (FHA) protein